VCSRSIPTAAETRVYARDGRSVPAADLTLRTVLPTARPIHGSDQGSASSSARTDRRSRWCCSGRVVPHCDLRGTANGPRPVMQGRQAPDVGRSEFKESYLGFPPEPTPSLSLVAEPARHHQRGRHRRRRARNPLLRGLTGRWFCTPRAAELPREGGSPSRASCRGQRFRTPISYQPTRDVVPGA